MSSTGRMWRRNWRFDSCCARSRFSSSGQSLRCFPGRNEDSMGLAITWRNPHPVQSGQRRTKVSENGSRTRYFVEELIGGALEGLWVDLSTIEIACGGNASEPRTRRPADHISRATAAKRKKPASTGKRRVSSSTALAPLYGLWRGVSSQFDERAVRNRQGTAGEGDTAS
jgi:hypothetical protein